MAEETQAVETQEIPLDQATQAEFKKARAEGKDVVTREAVAPEEKAAGEEKPKVRGGFQAKIDRLIKQQASTEERAAAAERKAAELEAKLNGNGTEKKETKADAEPVRENFQTEAEFIRALTRWEVKQELKAEREAEEKEAQATMLRELHQAYNQRMIALQAEDAELAKLFEQPINVPAALEGPIKYEMENGAEVAVFLARNPEICEELVKLPPSKAVAEAWKISEQLEKNSGEEAETEEEEEPEEKAAAEEEKPVRKAPAPIKPVSGGTTRSTIPLGKADYQTYKKLRAQGRVQ